jgi:hypothetical protein
MPYISQEAKDGLEHHIAQNVGELTYEVTSQLAMFLDERLGRTDELHYEDLAVCLAALEGAKADFIERVLKPYERQKAIENFDVWGRGVIEYVGGEFFGYPSEADYTPRLRALPMVDGGQTYG